MSTLDNEAIRHILWFFDGTLSSGSGALRIYNNSGHPKHITEVFLSVSVAPEGQPILVDVNLDDFNIFTSQAKPQISTDEMTGRTAKIDFSTWDDGSYLTCDIDQVGGSGFEGENLSVQVMYRRY